MMIAAIIMSGLAGVTVAISRMLNARLTMQTSALVSTLFNYIVGLPVSAAVLLLTGWQMRSLVDTPPTIWMFTGGLLGVVAVFLSSIVAVRISSFYISLLTFVGQVFTGIVIDILLTGHFAWQNLAGGALVAAGLIFNLWVEKSDNAKKKAASATAGEATEQ